ncbi:hypothetical protein F511_27597 [Dorcoceras hygrometricum]|uniref:Uncharacterized protein n=1 Tax=Dorcoceras hygrometricum TaxID=472368 RepID=A0A2Z7C069_9LAMI|nr:hypothetical protein F511_27597 [Dorcoceras hygrometricum]
MNQLQALEEEDGPTGTSKGNQLEHLSGPSMMMSLVTTSCSADEERSAGARGPARTEAKKSRKLELERESSAGALSVDDISSDVINQQKIYQQRATVQPAVDSADGSCNDGFSRSTKTKEFSRGAKMKKRSAGMMRTSWYIKMVQLSQDVVPVASKLQRYESSRSDEPAAKQLTIYEELSKLDVNC